MAKKDQAEPEIIEEVISNEEEVKVEMEPVVEPAIQPAKADYYEKLFRGGK